MAGLLDFLSSLGGPGGLLGGMQQQNVAAPQGVGFLGNLQSALQQIADPTGEARLRQKQIMEYGLREDATKDANSQIEAAVSSMFGQRGIGGAAPPIGGAGLLASLSPQARPAMSAPPMNAQPEPPAGTPPPGGGGILGGLPGWAPGEKPLDWGPGPAGPTPSPAPPASTGAMAQAQMPGQPQGAPSSITANSTIAGLIKVLTNPHLQEGQRKPLEMLLQQVMPAGNKIMQLPDGTVLSVNERSGAATPLYKAAPKPQVVGPDSSLVSETGQPLYQSPGKTHVIAEGSSLISDTGKPLYQPPASQNPFAHGGKNSKEENDAAMFGDRMAQSHAIITKLEGINSGAGGWSTGATANTTIPGVGRVGDNPIYNTAITKERQQFDQAQRDFINAVLRRESGKAISQSEFDNARKQYFPQPGDGPEVLSQKRINRQTEIEGLMRSAGSHYTPPPGYTPRKIQGRVGDTQSDPLGIR